MSEPLTEDERETLAALGCPRCGGAVVVDLRADDVSCYGECGAYIGLPEFRREHAHLAARVAEAVAADRATLARVEALADELLAFNCEEQMAAIPRHVDVPDDYESGMNDAGRRIRAALAGPEGGAG